MAENFQNFYVTKLREACDASATTIYVDNPPNFSEGTLVIEFSNSTKHEIIHFTGKSGYGLTGCTRGHEGTTAQSHSAGVDVRQNVTAGILDKIINRAITTENIADNAVTANKIDFTTMKVWVPDYSNAVNLGGIASYTATSCGWISAHYYNYKTTGHSNTSSIFVNGVRVITDTTEAKTSQGAMASQGTCLIPISTGDVVTGMTKSTEDGDCKFIPGKWVSQ